MNQADIPRSEPAHFVVNLGGVPKVAITFACLGISTPTTAFANIPIFVHALDGYLRQPAGICKFLGNLQLLIVAY